MFFQQLAQAEIAEHRQLALSLATKDVDRDSHGRPLKYPHAHQCPPKPIPAALFEAGVINRDFIKLPKHKRDEVKRDVNKGHVRAAVNKIRVYWKKMERKQPAHVNRSLQQLLHSQL